MKRKLNIYEWPWKKWPARTYGVGKFNETSMSNVTLIYYTLRATSKDELIIIAFRKKNTAKRKL